MEYDKLQGITKPVSKLGFGCWGIGGSAYGATDDDVSVDAIRTAIEAGINFFDTSPSYGRSESILGRILPDYRDDVIIATKFQIEDDPAISVERSLQSLNTEYIDLLQLHSPNMALITQECLWKLDRLAQAGQITAYGISVKSPSDAREAISLGFKNIQANFSLVDQRIIDEELPAYNCSLVARTPLCFGLLNEKLDKNALPLLDHRKGLPNKIFELFNDSGKLFMDEIFTETGISNTIVAALAFCMSWPRVVTTIPGMLTREQVKQNCSAINNIPFSDSLLEKLYDIYKEYFYVGA